MKKKILKYFQKPTKPISKTIDSIVFYWILMTSMIIPSVMAALMLGEITFTKFILVFPSAVGFFVIQGCIYLAIGFLLRLEVMIPKKREEIT